MDFVNNWSRPITLAAGATTLALDLPDGVYRLTLADSASAPTRWEIIDATVTANEAVLTRSAEGFIDQDWPDGSVIYCSITAGQLSDLFSRLDELTSRVAALESDAAPNNALTDANGEQLTDEQGAILTTGAIV